MGGFLPLSCFPPPLPPPPPRLCITALLAVLSLVSEVVRLFIHQKEKHTLSRLVLLICPSGYPHLGLPNTPPLPKNLSSNLPPPLPLSSAEASYSRAMGKYTCGARRLGRGKINRSPRSRFLSPALPLPFLSWCLLTGASAEERAPLPKTLNLNPGRASRCNTNLQGPCALWTIHCPSSHHYLTGNVQEC